MSAAAATRGGTAWQAGATVGRYLLLAPLAEGGMAQIWLARQTGVKGFEKLVVVKRMSATLEADVEHVEMFLSEARLAAQLNHPNVVQIFELGEEAGAYYIAMEFVDGENLSHVRKESVRKGLHLPDVLTARLIAWAAEGLHDAHTRVGLDGKPLGVVHRDVSPQNLLITYQGGLKVVDFGIAKLQSQATNSGKLKGKIAYMAPEQARAEAVDARADVFALGVVLFEQLTRTRLAGKLNELELLKYMSGDDPFPRVSERRPDVSRELSDIVSTAMERDRRSRYQTAKELQLALEGWIRTTGESATSADVADTMHRLFADREESRRRLLDTALKTEFTPNAARTLQDMVTGITSESASSRISASEARSIVHPNRLKWPAVVGLLGFAAALGIGTLVFQRRQPAPEQPVVEVVPLPPKEPATVVVDTVPPGAQVSVDGRPAAPAPVTLADAAVGEHRVVATLDGHQPAERTVRVERQGQRLDVVLALIPVPAAPPPAEPAPEPAKPAATVAPRRAMGRLTLKTEPWTTVYLGKSKLGDTPLLNVPLPAGRQVLKLVNPESNIQSSVEVEIPPNGTLVKKLRL